MALITTLATILKTYEYSETSKILRLLTRDHGLVSVIAKGARRPRSRFGGLLEPFTDGVATYYAKEGRELHTLSVFDLRRERQALGRELLRYAGGGLLTEIAFRFAPSATDEQLFHQLRAGLDRVVAEERELESAILEETWKLILCLGFAPGLEGCAVCGRVPGPEEAAHFDIAEGVLVCAGCGSGGAGPNRRPLSAPARAELVRLVQGRGSHGGRVTTARIQRDLLRDFIAYHLAEHRPLNSFRFLEEGLR